MTSPRTGLLALASAMALSACAGQSDVLLDGQRTVFANPYVAPELDRRGIGPQCDVSFGRDATCVGGPVVHRGRHASIGTGERVHLTRAQRRILRERAELAEALRNQPPATPPPPPVPPPVLPTAKAAEKP